MSKVMLKMLADMAGISPDDIADNIEQFKRTALDGVELLKRFDARLAAIENHLGIAHDIEERLENGEEIGTTDRIEQVEG